MALWPKLGVVLGVAIAAMGHGCSGPSRTFAGMDPGSGGEAGVPMSSSGGADSTTTGAGAGAGAPLGGAPDEGEAAVGKPGQPCGTPGALACAGYAQRQRLVCLDGVWSAYGSCAVGDLCNTALGEDAGLCAPILEACADAQPGSLVCNGQDVVECGPDLVTSRIEASCEAEACVDGACQGRCEPGTARCADGRNAVETCEPSGEFGSPVPCDAETPVCGGAGVCGVPPSCQGLLPTCGLDESGSCCAAPLVPGGTFDRNNDAEFPATVSELRLDKYEISVGRFRKFVEAYTPDIIAAGAGKNPNDPSDPGWDSAWNANLPADADALAASLRCSTSTWLGGDDNRPLNCLTWYQAYAFCIWDGGRLPTDAEWNYVAAGGSEQRDYPWGSLAPGDNAELAVLGCFYNGTGTCTGVDNIAPVGSVPAGNGKWGHADLVGNLYEMVRDRGGGFPTPCVDCALWEGTGWIIRGAAYFHSGGATVSRTTTGGQPHMAFGARCARDP